MKTKVFTLLLVLFFVLLNVSSLKATHLAGGSITYKCLGGNIYKVTVTIYRDCKGIALAVPFLNVKGCGNNFTVTYTGSAVVPILITPSCNSTVRTACDFPAGTAPGIQKYDYSFTVNLSSYATCSDWIFSCDFGARNLTGPLCTTSQNMYVEAHLNNIISCHDSPIFNTDPKLFLCTNDNNIIDCSAKSCDSLKYSLTCAKASTGVCACYNSGFDSTHFLTGTIFLDNISGQLMINPTLTSQVGIYVVLVLQYENGILVGSVMREVQVYVLSCSNILPRLTGIDSTSQYSMTMIANKYKCFNLFSSDSNLLDSTRLSWNAEISSASFNTDNSKNQKGLFCWAPTISDTGCLHCFTVSVKDNACPQNGISFGRFCVTVVDSGYPIYVNNLPDQVYTVTISQNPFSTSSKITVQNSRPPKNAQFTLSDIFGRNVMNQKMPKNELIIERGNLPQGIYFYSIHDNDRLMATGKIVIVE